MLSSDFNRRQFIAGLAATTTVMSAGKTLAYSKFNVGSSIVTALSDGSLTVPSAFFSNTSETEQAELGETIQLAANTYAYRNGGRTFLFDAGAGSDFYISEQFPSVGKLATDLETAGISPETVTDIVITHLHIDHIGGLVHRGGALFPNAKIHVSEADWEFWTQDGLEASLPAPLKPMAQAIAAISMIVGENVLTHKGEADLGAGVGLIPTPGHTPGHSGILLSSGTEQLLLVGDAIVSDAIHFSNPDAGWVLEMDKELAAKTRRSILDRAATDKIMIAGSHLSNPGTGFVERHDDNYRFVPS